MTKEFLEKLDRLVKLDRGGNEGSQESEENWVLLVCRDPKESQVRPDQTDQRAALVPPVPWETWVLLVFRECRENEESPVRRDPKATGERSVRKVQKVHLVTTAQEELPDPSAR